MIKIPPKRTMRELVARQIAISLTQGVDHKKYLFITNKFANCIKWRKPRFRDFCRRTPQEYPGNQRWWAPTITPRIILNHTDTLQRLLPIRHLLENLTIREKDD